MKITDLQLEQYGIYNNVSWKPPQNQLVVVMGENESGKTTLLNFIRDMLFGYRRGAWHDKKGNMGILRDNGEAYRFFRSGKTSWFEDGKGKRLEEDPMNLWWHGLSRSMYEHIFAVGLEDLQGAGFLSEEEVRSRFFMLQGGDKLADARQTLSDRKEALLLPSAQSRRKINQLLEKQKTIAEEADLLSRQEDSFAELQKKQARIKKDIAGLTEQLAKDKEQDRIYEKKLGAWKYYVRAREIKRRLALGEQVKMFPKNGKEQWNQLMSRMEVIHDQREQLQKKLDEYTPHTKEEVIPWAGSAEALEKLYTDLGQWSQTEEDLKELQVEKQAWKADFSHMGYALPLWDRMLPVDEEFPQVDWEEGRKLAQSVSVRENEYHFWEQREPEVEKGGEELAEEPVQTEEEWHAFETRANQIESLIHDETDLKEEYDQLSRQEDRRYTFWFWLGALLLLGAAGGIAAFFLAIAGTAALYGTVGGAAAAGLAFMANSRVIHKKDRNMKRVAAQMETLQQKRAALGEGFTIPLPKTEEDLVVFHNALQQKRAAFYKAQAREQALSWKRETLKRQQKEHQKWEEEGASFAKEKQRVEKSWKDWLSRNHLPETGADNLSALQEQWQKIYSARGAGKIIDARSEKAQEKLDDFKRRALSIIRSTGASLSVTPETIAEIYEENRKRLLAWQTISEKNKQHETYQREMDRMNEQWEACQKSMHALFAMVNAKNAEEFAERVTAHEQHDQLMKEWESVRQDIRLYAGSQEEFDRLWQSLESGEYDDWMGAHQKLQDEIASREKELGELQKQQGAAENEIYRLAGDESITKVLQEKEEIETELKSAVEEWLTYVYASHFMEEAQKQYESGKRPQIIKKANDFLSAMTSGRYSLQVSDDGKTVCTVDSMHNQKDAKIWSSGTGDQVYLALRLSMALAFGRQIEPLPMVLDDIFVRFDETRQKETLRFLLELGKKQQIFLFTCHEQTMRIAEAMGKELGTGSFVRLKAGKIQASPV